MGSLVAMDATPDWQWGGRCSRHPADHIKQVCKGWQNGAMIQVLGDFQMVGCRLPQLEEMLYHPCQSGPV